MLDFQSVRGGVGYSDPATDSDSRRRNQLAQLMLQQSNAAPAVGVTGALNKILSGAIAGWQLGKDSEEQTARVDAKNATMADALRAGQGQAAESKQYGDGTTINWNERKADPSAMAAILAGNRDTAPLGMQMQISQMDNAAKSQAELAKEAREHDWTLQHERSKPIDIGGDHQWFYPDAPGQVPAQAPAPQMAPPAQAPSGGIDVQTAANGPPVPLTATSGSGPMGPNSNNPGNIRTNDGNAWQGKTTQPGSQFEQFDTPENGIRAMGVLVSNYAKQGTNTLRGIVGKWAPPNENQTGALITNAAKRTGIDPDQPLDMSDPAVRTKVVQALLMQEQGKVPYGQDVVQAGVDASFGRPAPAAPQGVQVADASGAIPASALAPQGPQRITMGGQSGTVIGGQGGPKYRLATPEEVQAAGLPKGTSAQVDRNGQYHVLAKGDGGDAGPYGGPTLPAQDRNTVYTLEQKMMNGEKLTPQEQWRYDTSKAALEAPRTIMTDQGLTQVPGAQIPSMRGQPPGQTPAPVPATDTVPNPVAAQVPAAVPTATPPGQPQVKIIQPKAAKPLPEGIQKGMTENVTALRKIEDAMAALTKAPDATGAGVGAVNQWMPNAVTNFMFPEGVNARALIADIGSLKLHDRSGANITASESPRLAPFIPSVGDTQEVIKNKLANFQREYVNTLNDMNSAYGADSGYAPNLSVVETLKNGRTPRYQAPISGQDPNQQKPDLSGHSDADILKSLGM